MKSETYRLVIKRAQAFSSEEVRLAKTVFAELMHVSSFENVDKEYKSVLQEQAVERGICSFYQTSPRKLSLNNRLFTTCASKTYEGRRISFGFIVTNNEVTDVVDNTSFERFSDKDFLALLSDGVCSNIILDKQAI